MCIAFDGAYILEAPPADPGSTDEHRPVPEIMPASAGGEGGQLDKVSDSPNPETMVTASSAKL